MRIVPSGIDGLIELIPDVFSDDRGWFVEAYKETTFHEHGIHTAFRQDNLSFSKKGVIRGMHMQLPPHEQAKLVRVTSGKVLDVVADLRKGSPTFGEVYYCELDATRQNMLFIPEGFVHGFAALEDSIFIYKTSSVYHREAEAGIRWDDPDLNIRWPVSAPLISGKDRQLPTLRELLRKSVISRS